MHLILKDLYEYISILFHSNIQWIFCSSERVFPSVGASLKSVLGDSVDTINHGIIYLFIYYTI